MKTSVKLSKHTILQTAINYRLGYEAEANETLMFFIDALGRRLDTIPHDTLMELTTYMQLALKSQARQDFINVADQLEYEILPRLSMVDLLTD